MTGNSLFSSTRSCFHAPVPISILAFPSDQHIPWRTLKASDSSVKAHKITSPTPAVSTYFLFGPHLQNSNGIFAQIKTEDSKSGTLLPGQQAHIHISGRLSRCSYHQTQTVLKCRLWRIARLKRQPFQCYRAHLYLSSLTARCSSPFSDFVF